MLVRDAVRSIMDHHVDNFVCIGPRNEIDGVPRLSGGKGTRRGRSAREAPICICDLETPIPRVDATNSERTVDRGSLARVLPDVDWKKFGGSSQEGANGVASAASIRAATKPESISRPNRPRGI